jgi:transposase
MEIKVIGLDIGKTWFHLVGCNRAGKPVARQKYNRVQLMHFLSNTPPCLIGMEACPGSQHLARAMQRLGHEARRIAPKFIKAYLKSQKNDFNDAEAIAEAVSRPTMRFVAVKSNEQLDVQALHRLRDRLVRQRTAMINQIRAFLIEYGLPVKEGRAALQRDLPRILENADNGLSDRMRQLVSRMREHWKSLDESIDQCTRDLEILARRSDLCRRLETVPGIGPLGASALVAAVGNGAAFARGRDLAAWLGLVPRQNSTGGKTMLSSMTKRGNPYVRKLLIHGARSLVRHLNREHHELGLWITQLEQRSHKNVVAVAVANKIARIAWAVLAKNQVYRPEAAAMAV